MSSGNKWKEKGKITSKIKVNYKAPKGELTQMKVNKYQGKIGKLSREYK